MNIPEFEEIEAMKAYFRKQLLEELQFELNELRFSDDPDALRDGSLRAAADSEDHGFTVAVTKMNNLINSKK